jgi:hypothetical protein
VKLVATAVALAGVAFAAPAAAVEREFSAGADLGGAMLVQSGKASPDIGPGAGLHATYGLSDAFNLMFEGGWSLLSPTTPHGASVPRTLPAWAANADVGVVYILDVFQWVPYAGLLVGGYDFAGGTIAGSRLYLGASLALGLDYRVRPRWTVGVAVRQHMVTDVTAYPSYTQAFARLEYVWGGW